MKTKGIEVHHGYLMPGFRGADGTWTPAGDSVPTALWGRLKHQVLAAGLVDEFKLAEASAKDDQSAGRLALSAEQHLFQSWSRRLGFTPPPGHYAGQQLWPWTRGWTEDLVDAYLAAPWKREVAA